MKKPRNTVPDWQTLATALSITPRSLRRIRDRHADNPTLPKPGRNGSHDLEAWRTFFDAHDVNANAGIRSDEINAMRSRLAQQQVIKLQLANELTRRQQIALTELQAKLPPFLMAIRTAMDQCIPELATGLEGIDDHSEREEIIQEQFNKVFGMLAACPWLDEVPLEMDGFSLPSGQKDKDGQE
jgi:hypothetical protein